MDVSVGDYAIKKALMAGADYAEARLEQHLSEGYVLRNGSLEVGGFDDDKGLSIRLIVNGAPAFLATNDLRKTSINKLILKGVRTARSARQLLKEPVVLSEERVVNRSYAVKQKQDIRDVSVEDKIRFLMSVQDHAKQVSPNLIGWFYSLATVMTKKYYANSEGSSVYSELPHLGFGCFLTIKQGTKVKQRYLQFKSVGGWELTNKWGLNNRLEAELNGLNRMMGKTVKPPRGLVDVVISPEVVGIAVHESVGHPYEADRIFGRESAQAGESFVRKEMIGDRIASEEVSVVDNPTLKNSAGYYLYDDEGVKARPKYLIRKGVINEFLHNRSTAAMMGVRSNGSARAASYSFEPIVRMSNTYLMRGEHSFDELIEGVRMGVFIKSFMEWNIDDKRFNQKYVGNEAYLIENGRITKPVLNPVIETTTTKFWGAVDGVSKDFSFEAGTCGKGDPMQGIPVLMGGAAARLRNIRLGGIG